MVLLYFKPVFLKCRHLRSSAVCPFWLFESTLDLPRLNVPWISTGCRLWECGKCGGDGSDGAADKHWAAAGTAKGACQGEGCWAPEQRPSVKGTVSVFMSKPLFKISLQSFLSCFTSSWAVTAALGWSQEAILGSGHCCLFPACVLFQDWTRRNFYLISWRLFLGLVAIFKKNHKVDLFLW